MRYVLMAVYTALALGANAALAEDPASLRQGDMQKLGFHAAPADLPAVELLTLDDKPASLADYRGQWVVVNFWATWCAPCRTEMPTLDQLQADMPAIAVVPVATGRNAVDGIRQFYEEAEITNLPVLRDPKSTLAQQMGVMALPITVILNPDGQEVARLIGDADWNSDSAKAILHALQENG